MDRIRLPTNHAGRRFTPRPFPDDDPAAYVLKAVKSAIWPYRVSVTAHADADTLLRRQPQYFVVEPINENTCRVELSADTPQVLAVWLGMLGVDFDVEDPAGQPALIEHLQQIAGRYLRVLGRIHVAPNTTSSE